MRLRVYAQGAAAVSALALALTGCTGSDDDAGTVDSEPGAAAASPSAAPSGRYETLPDPCTAVSPGTLEELLPGADDASDADDEGDDDASDEATEEALAGEPSLTYDTDREASCSWKREDTGGGHGLKVGLERIVSYDAEISDEAQAQQIYVERADKHGVNLSGLQQPDLPDKSDIGNGAGSSTPAQPSPSPEDSSGEDGEDGDETLATPRLLDGVGDEGFLAERIRTAGSGTRSEVTVVFRTSNALVTVRYSERLSGPAALPDSAELQEQAEQVAGSLAEQLSE